MMKKKKSDPMDFNEITWNHPFTNSLSPQCTLYYTVLYWGLSLRQYDFYSSVVPAHFSTVISKQTNTVSRSNSSQPMLEAVCGCFMPCNVFLAGNSEVSLKLQCFTAELITYLVCECDAPECTPGQSTAANCDCTKIL